MKTGEVTGFWQTTLGNKFQPMATTEIKPDTHPPVTRRGLKNVTSLKRLIKLFIFSGGFRWSITKAVEGLSACQSDKNYPQVLCEQTTLNFAHSTK
jgi:hypothetical protein